MRKLTRTRAGEKAFYVVALLTCLVLAITLFPMPEMGRVSADATVHIDNMYVNANNNLYVVFNGVHNYYRLYVRRVGAVFGDPGKNYYQIYPGGTWPKDLWIVTDVNPNTVYCAEIRSNDNSIRHDIVAYRTGSGSRPYVGTVIHWGSCPEVDGNIPPNVPKLISPANGSTTTSSSVTLQVADTGDPDNYPRTYRDYYYRIEKTDGTWTKESGWTDNTWAVTLPSAGTYRWRAKSGDGELASGWTNWWTFSYNAPPPPGIDLNVRYVDQVYVQQTCEWHNGACYWNHCGPSSVAMVLHYEGKESRDVLYNRQATLDLVCDVKPGCTGGSSVGMMVNTLRNRGIQAHTDWSPTFSEIRQNIQNGHPAILFVRNGSHAVVAVGYKDSGAVLVNDPYGGVSWWITGVKNIPPGSTPKLNGDGVEYTSIGGLLLSGAIFITGPSPAGEPTAVVIDSSGGMLTAENVQVDFAPSLNEQSLASALPITVTYTPQVSSTRPTEEFEAGVMYFQLNAVDINNQPVLALNTPFTFTIGIDIDMMNNWDTQIGQVSEDGTPSLLTNPSGEVAPVLARWDDSSGHWVIIPGSFDSLNSQLVVSSNQFGEFGVLIQRRYNCYLPIISSN